MADFTTLTAFLSSKRSNISANDIVEFNGFATKGDKGAARWKALGTQGTPSTTPEINNLPTMSDASGNQFTLIGSGVIDLNALGGETQVFIDIAEAAGFVYSQNIADGDVTATQTLNAGQLIVATTVLASTGVFFVSENSTNGLSKRLTFNVDYTVTDTNEITLTSSYPQGVNFVEEGSISAQQPLLKTQSPGPVELIAHRGFRDTGFENTLISLSYAQTVGADSLEFDCSISSNSIWYLFHDVTLDDLTDGTGNFIDATSSTIDGLKYDKGASTAFDALGITKLDDVLDFVREKGLRFYPEMKNLRNDTTDVVLFMDKLNSFDLLDLAIVQSFNSAQLVSARAAYPNATLAMAFNDVDHAQNIIDTKAANANMSINEFSHFTTSAQVDLYSDAGLDLAVYTPNLANNFQNLLRLGVRKIMSDKSTFL